MKNSLITKRKGLLITSVIALFAIFSVYLVHAQSIITSVTSDSNSIIKIGSTQTITWNTVDFPSNGKVNINLIKKVSDSPISYDLVRQLSVNTPNDGTETWIPEAGEVGDNLQIEVTCAYSLTFKNGCVSKTDNNTFAVKGDFSSSLASALDAIIQFFTHLF